ncbi:MAG TPA: tRNA 2-selenouridine(34) synthase MnmH [Bacillota bacterium]|nr:tRNA 2-selenouridine(34) synthase MnmH [Bacillota bacterium]
MKEIEIEQALEEPNTLFIDVRSPGEFAEAHIPGAINIPLFSNDERANVGTIYKQDGQEPAKWLGMQLVSPKIPEMMESIKKEIDQGKNPIIYCWRGGMRSKSVCTFADFSGLPVSRLSGGFKKYRQWVVDHLTPELLPNRFVVLHGMTGVGKTTILHMLKEKGFPILDLEKCAGHRGSVFGGIGKEVHNQKTFESLLVHDLQKVAGLPYVFIEAESRRIGKATQPGFMLEGKKKGIHIILETNVQTRVKRIYDEYVELYQNDPHFQQRVTEAINPIIKRFNPETKVQVLECIQIENYEKLIEILLIDYYDSRYSHKLDEYEGPFHFINVDDQSQAVEEIIQFMKKDPTNMQKTQP